MRLSPMNTLSQNGYGARYAADFSTTRLLEFLDADFGESSAASNFSTTQLAKQLLQELGRRGIPPGKVGS